MSRDQDSSLENSKSAGGPCEVRRRCTFAKVAYVQFVKDDGDGDCQQQKITVDRAV